MPMVVRKMSQVVGLLLLMSTLFLILSVSLYTSEAPNANHYVSDGSTIGQNRGGVVRKALADGADWALQGFGGVVALLTGIAVIECVLSLTGTYRHRCGRGRAWFTLFGRSECVRRSDFHECPHWGCAISGWRDQWQVVSGDRSGFSQRGDYGVCWRGQ